VDFAAHVGAPLGKRSVGCQRKNRIKGCLEGGGNRKKSTDKETESKEITSWQDKMSKLW
jgi:hypothetical protein